MRGARGKPTRGVRPTTAKTLESLLAILQPRLEGARACDLFAGTGQVGLGLLEGGAASVTFVEGSVEVARQLQRRLRTEADPQGWSWALSRGKIPAALAGLSGPYDLFWADPPYDWDDHAKLLPTLAKFAAPEAWAVIEHHHKTPYLEGAGWRLVRQKKFGETRLSFFSYSAFVEPADEEEDARA